MKVKVQLFFHEFVKMVLTLLSFDKPLVAAINGHSPAGGCVMALTADYRVIVDDDRVKIGLNEVPVGIAIPPFIFELYSFWIGHRLAYQNLLAGRMMTPQEALNIGLVDQALPPDEMTEGVKQAVSHYLSMDENTFSTSKRAMRAKLVDHLQVNHSVTEQAMFAHFWKETSRERLKRLVEKISK